MWNIYGHLNSPTIYGCINTTPYLVASNGNDLSWVCGLAGLSWAVLLPYVVLAGALMWLYLAGHLAGAGTFRMVSSTCFEFMQAFNWSVSIHPHMASLLSVVQNKFLRAWRMDSKRAETELLSPYFIGQISQGQPRFKGRGNSPSLDERSNVIRGIVDGHH